MKNDDDKKPDVPVEAIARRQMLGRMSVALGVVGGCALAAPAVGFIIAPLFRHSPREWRPLGRVSDFKIGETINVMFIDASPLPWAGVTSRTAAWLRRVNETDFQAFSVNCAHLGCPVRWMPDAKLFMCPCHGGVYYADGSRASGPPERGLFTYEVKVENGKLMINAGQMPTLQNRAKSGPCPGTAEPKQPALIARIESCPDTPQATTARGTDASTIG